MSSPSELGRLIVPYISETLTVAERRRVKEEIERNPEFARAVEEFRETLSLFPHDLEASHADQLHGLEQSVYRQVVARTTEEQSRRHRRSIWFRLTGGGFAREAWRLWTSAAALSTAAAVAIVYLVVRAPAPMLHAPVAGIRTPMAIERAWSDSPHERFRRTEIERAVNEAQIVQHGRGDAFAAEAQWRQIAGMTDSPDDLWALTLARAELSNIGRATLSMPVAGEPNFLFVDARGR